MTPHPDWFSGCGTEEQAPEAKPGQTGTSDLKTVYARDKNQQAAKATLQTGQNIYKHVSVGY